MIARGEYVWQQTGKKLWDQKEETHDTKRKRFMTTNGGINVNKRRRMAPRGRDV